MNQRDLGICQFSLTNPHQPIVIENLLEDERTKNKYRRPESALIRFYVGAPLVSSRGFSLGTLCVVDKLALLQRYVKFGPQVASNKLLTESIVTLNPGKLQGGAICDNFAQPAGL